MKDLNVVKRVKTPEDQIAANSWASRPFDTEKEIHLPVYNFIDGKFTGKFFSLDHDIFNQPLRRDLVARAFHYFSVKGKLRTKVAKTKGDVAGSGKKPAPQKGRGAARQGNKRAPQRKKGGAAHGPKFQDLTESLNKKVRLKALKVLLSAKLYENKIIAIESEKLATPKTRHLDQILEPYKNERLLFLTSFKQNENFMLAQRNLEYVKVKNPEEFSIPNIMRADKIFVTKDGLRDLEIILNGRKTNLFRNKSVPMELEYKKFLKTKEPKLVRKNPFYHKVIKPTAASPELEGVESVD